MPPVNDGSRPSRLALDRYATGELSAESSEEIRRLLEERPEAQAHLEAIDQARAALPALDTAALRARAAAIAMTPPELPEAANRPARVWLAPVLLIAAMILIGLLSTLQTGPEPHTAIRSGDALRVYQLRDNQLHLYRGDALGSGEVVGFKVAAAGRESVVVLSVDGEGRVSVFYPDTAGDPVPLRGDGMVALPGSVVLDAAPGPETFFAVFDTPVDEARDEAGRAWQSGGVEGLQDWIQNDGRVDGIAIERK